MVDDRGYLVPRAELQELGRELLALAQIHRLDGVVEPGLLDHLAPLVAVVRRPEVEIEHVCLRGEFFDRAPDRRRPAYSAASVLSRPDSVTLIT